MPDILTLLFPLTFAAMAVWESAQPSRAVTVPLTLRWFGNIVLLGFTWLIAVLLPFLTAFGAAVIAREHGWGLFNIITLPPAVAFVLSFVALDFSAYWTHRLFHAFGPLWRAHALHHSDTDLDVTTTIRHHPLEVVVQMVFDAAVVLALGFPPEAVALFSGIAIIVQTINHANVVLPGWLRWLDVLVVTPDLHRIHHSTVYAENNANFGEIFPLWDRWFGTLRSAPEGELRIGLTEFPGAKFQRLDMLLLQPFLVTPVTAPEPQS